VHLIDELESRGLVERTRHPSDRRAHAVSLSPAAKEVLSQAHERVRAGEAEFLSPLSPAEQEQLHSLLIRLGTQG
jgi:DNA-binding MarR family transcriptional regulator